MTPYVHPWDSIYTHDTLFTHMNVGCHKFLHVRAQYTSPQASWWWDFDPCAPRLMNLYHSLPTEHFSGCNRDYMQSLLHPPLTLLQVSLEWCTPYQHTGMYVGCHKFLYVTEIRGLFWYPCTQRRTACSLCCIRLSLSYNETCNSQSSESERGMQQ